MRTLHLWNMNRADINRETRLAILLGAVFLGGCAMSPGFYMDESKLRDKAQPVLAGTDANKHYEVTPISPVLVASLKARDSQLQNESNLVLAREIQDYQYRIEPGDLLAITVFNHPELGAAANGAGPAGTNAIPGGSASTAAATAVPVENGQMAASYMINSDGTFSFPFIGKVPAAGKTKGQIRDFLAGKLVPYIRNPQIFVQVSSYRSQRVSVAGEVKNPGILPITDQPMTAERAIQMAGGTTPEADLRHVTLLRNGKIHNLDLQGLYEKGDVLQNILLHDGDTVEVADRSQNKVFVLGEVSKSGAYQMDKGRMTLADAIGNSGGFTNQSNPSKIYVIRGNVQNPTIYKLDGRSPDAMLMASQFQLLPKDVVYVSPSEISRWDRVINSIMPSLTGVVLGTQLR